jgi:ABC-type multidrug transport system fused ATPase/permease subunit
MELVVDTKEVRFENVSFAYEPRKPVIEKLNLLAEAGKTITIVGESGARESTVINLLYGLQDVREGSITIDGQDVRDVTSSSLQSAIGIVPQKPDLFNCSILENGCYSRLDATDEEIEDACKAAAIYKCIMNFPDGYKAMVRKRGV